MVNLFSANLFWGHVTNGSEGRTGLCQVTGTLDQGQTKIDNSHATVRVD